MSGMGEKIRITATYDVEVIDEMELRTAGFKARHANPALALSYNEHLQDSASEALKILLGHAAITNLPGARPVNVTVVAEPITDVP